MAVTPQSLDGLPSLPQLRLEQGHWAGLRCLASRLHDSDNHCAESCRLQSLSSGGALAGRTALGGPPPGRADERHRAMATGRWSRAGSSGWRWLAPWRGPGRLVRVFDCVHRMAESLTPAGLPSRPSESPGASETRPSPTGRLGAPVGPVRGPGLASLLGRFFSGDLPPAIAESAAAAAAAAAAVAAAAASIETITPEHAARQGRLRVNEVTTS